MSTSEATRSRVLKAAERVFARHGYHEAAVDEIVHESHTSKGSVYFHFPNKESLFMAVMDHLGNRLVQRVERSMENLEGPAQRLDVALATTLKTLTKHRTLAKLLLAKGTDTGSAFTKKRATIYARFASIIKDQLDQAGVQLASPPMDTEVVAYAWMGAISETVVKWLETGQTHPVEEALPTLRTLLLRGSSLNHSAGDPLRPIRDRIL